MAALPVTSFCIIHPKTELDDTKFQFDHECVKIEIPSSDSSGDPYLDDSALDGGVAEEDYIRFDQVFPPNTSQERIFQDIARHHILPVLDFKSTIFIASGATGSGKTFAVTGGAKDFTDRGLIPRSVSALFEAVNSRPDKDDFELSVSFYELYKDSVVDLLSERRRKVPVKIGEKGPMLVGLLRQVVSTESDAYHLLFQGDSNRHFERFPHNSETSRGHVFYLLHITHLASGSRSSLAFVDLAAPIGMRSSANTSIMESLDALKATLLALRDGRDPAWESSILPQLLEPWLRPPYGQPPSHVCLINPIRYSSDTRQEVHEWLTFARLTQEACSGQPLEHSPTLKEGRHLKSFASAMAEVPSHRSQPPAALAARLPLWGAERSIEDRILEAERERERAESAVIVQSEELTSSFRNTFEADDRQSGPPDPITDPIDASCTEELMQCARPASCSTTAVPPIPIAPTVVAQDASSCPKCGNIYMADSNFCRHCGAKREHQAAQDVAQTPPVPAPAALDPNNETVSSPTACPGGGWGTPGVPTGCATPPPGPAVAAAAALRTAASSKTLTALAARAAEIQEATRPEAACAARATSLSHGEVGLPAAVPGSLALRVAAPLAALAPAGVVSEGLRPASPAVNSPPGSFVPSQAGGPVTTTVYGPMNTTVGAPPQAVQMQCAPAPASQQQRSVTPLRAVQQASLAGAESPTRPSTLAVKHQQYELQQLQFVLQNQSRAQFGQNQTPNLAPSMELTQQPGARSPSPQQMRVRQLGLATAVGGATQQQQQRSPSPILHQQQQQHQTSGILPTPGLPQSQRTASPPPWQQQAGSCLEQLARPWATGAAAVRAASPQRVQIMRASGPSRSPSPLPAACSVDGSGSGAGGMNLYAAPSLPAAAAPMPAPLRQVSSSVGLGGCYAPSGAVVQMQPVRSVSPMMNSQNSASSWLAARSVPANSLAPAALPVSASILGAPLQWRGTTTSPLTPTSRNFAAMARQPSGEQLPPGGERRTAAVSSKDAAPQTLAQQSAIPVGAMERVVVRGGSANNSPKTS